MVEREIIMVDFDGTLTKGGRFWTDDKIIPNQRVIDWSNNEYKKGNVIIIFTARPYEVMRETVAWLIKHGVKYHGINMDKPGAQMYLDDKAINPNSSNGLSDCCDAPILMEGDICSKCKEHSGSELNSENNKLKTVTDVSKGGKNRRYPNMSDKEYSNWKSKLSKIQTGKKKGPRSDDIKKKISEKNSGTGNGRWKGGTRKKNGYISIYYPKHPSATKCGYVAEHRLVVEKKLGRYLNKEEQVHHIDFDKSNNEIENLMLFPTGNAHISFHRKIQQFGMTNPIRKQIAERWDKEALYAFDESDRLVEVNNGKQK